MRPELASELREQLRPFHNRRVEFEGTVSRIGSCFDPRSKRDVPSVCLQNVEIRAGDHEVIDHVWVIHSALMVNRGVAVGDTLRFTAQVYDYPHREQTDPNKTTTRLGLREPRNVVALNRRLEEHYDDGPARNGAAPVTVPKPAELVITKAMVEAAKSTPPPPPEPPPADQRRVLFDTLLKLVDEHGLEKVKKTLAAVETVNA